MKLEFSRFITKATEAGRVLSPIQVCLTIIFLIALLATCLYIYLAIYMFFVNKPFKEYLTVDFLTLLWSTFGATLLKAAQDTHIKAKQNGNGRKIDKAMMPGDEK
jgi:hypothetical protein